MKTHKVGLVLTLAAMLAGLLAPAAALGDSGRHGGPRHHGGRHVKGSRPAHVSPHGHFHRPFVPRAHPRFPHGSRHFYGKRYYAPPVVYGAAVAYGASVVYEPPVVYTSPAPVSITSFVATPAHPRVIEYSTGRYELRGDGFNMPHVWVWIPNPPPPPEPAPEPPPATQAAPPPPAASEVPSPSPSQLLYRWVDEQGVVHLTDNPASVPAQYRAPAARAQGGAS